MSVWLTIPSARPPAEANPVLQQWAAMGYKIALLRDLPADEKALRKDLEIGPVDLLYRFPDYPGYAEACNFLIKGVLQTVDPNAEWFTIGGDDVLPDPNKRADEIARECKDHFYSTVELTYPPARPSWAYDAKGIWPDRCGGDSYEAWGLFGVMQPTGDRYAGGQIDRICGSAWIGREFAKRAYKGTGPLWPGYTHMFVDEELQEVAKRYGVLWQRPDLTQLHMQYCRESAAIDSPAKEAKPPDHITHDGYTLEHWDKYQKIFNERKAAGFPGSELL